jgi:hypothetical protein
MGVYVYVCLFVCVCGECARCVIDDADVGDDNGMVLEVCMRTHVVRIGGYVRILLWRDRPGDVGHGSKHKYIAKRVVKKEQRIYFFSFSPISLSSIRRRPKTCFFEPPFSLLEL